MARTGSAGWMLLWAERNSGSDSTELKWARLSVEPFRVTGAVSAFPSACRPAPRDANGNTLYTRAIGRVAGDGVVLDREPAKLAVPDGLKVESLAIREHAGERRIVVGTDDENCGGVLRPLPLSAAGGG